MLFSGLPYLVGYMMISFAHHSVSATAFKVLLLTGRFITGVGMGWASAVVAVSLASIINLLQAYRTKGCLIFTSTAIY